MSDVTVMDVLSVGLAQDIYESGRTLQLELPLCRVLKHTGFTNINRI